MRIILDECLPRQLKQALTGHEVSTVREMGWGSAKNGELLTLATAEGFQVFITMDKNLRHQQHLPKYPISVITLRARNNTFLSLQPLVPELLDILPRAKAGEWHRIPQESIHKSKI